MNPLGRKSVGATHMEFEEMLAWVRDQDIVYPPLEDEQIATLRELFAPATEHRRPQVASRDVPSPAA